MSRIFMSLLIACSLSLSGCQAKKPSVATSSTPTPEIPKISDAACANTYQNFYRNDHLDFKIVFGYKDARPARYVGDRYERQYFIQKLLDFGFIRNPKKENDFVFKRMGLDGHLKEIELTIVSSSVGPDDDENRKNPFQKWSSEYAEKTFLDGLNHSDLLFYYGHSREGGGPDFSPPKLTRDLHTDYPWYKKNTPGVKKMVQAFTNATDGPKVLGLYSCVSDQLFTNTLLHIKPKLALMVSHSLLYYIDAIDGMFETLSALLEMKCQADFHPSGTEAIHFF